MDLSRHGPQARRSKRQAVFRKAPYAHPGEVNSTANSVTRADDHLSTHSTTITAPSWKKWLTRFVNPLHRDSSDDDQEEADQQRDDSTIPQSDENDEIDQNDENNEKDENLTEVQQEDNAEDTSNENTQSTVVAISSFEHSSTPEGSTVDETDLKYAKRHLEWDESDDKESKRPRTKDDLRSSTRSTRRNTPTQGQSMRRTTRSQAARVEIEEDSGPLESYAVESEHSFKETSLEIEEQLEDEQISLSSAQPSEEPVTVEEEPAQSAKSKGKKKKSKGKKKKKNNGEDIESLERELVKSDVRIAEKIQRSQELIDASELLLDESNQVEEATNKALDHAKDNPFSEYQSSDGEGEEVVAGDEEDEQTFHSTAQFEPTEDSNSENMEQEDLIIDYEETKYYPAEDDDEEESRDSVKYYPPESPSADGAIGIGESGESEDDREPSEVQEVEEVEQEVEQEEVGEKIENDRELNEMETLETTHHIDSSEDQEKSPSPPAAESVPESQLMGVEEFEFSPMQSRSPSPVHQLSTPSAKERFVDCPPIVTPKAEKIKSDMTHWEQPLHRGNNIAVLAAFFEAQQLKGKILTPEQAHFCHQLIEDSIMPSKNDSLNFGEEDVSFRNSSVALRQDTPVRPVTVSGRSHVASPSRSHQRAAPYAVKRQALGDLYHEANTEGSPKRSTPQSMDELLELDKYEGVEWDDLPNSVKIKRYLEWKDTESPEDVKRRKIQEKRAMKQRNAEILAKDRKRQRENVVSANRMDSSAGQSSEENEDVGAEHNKTTSTASVTPGKHAAPADFTKTAGEAATAVAAGAAALEIAKGFRDSAPVASSVAQKLLDIVGNSSKPEKEQVSDSGATSSSASTPASSSAPEPLPVPSSASSFSFAKPAEATKSGQPSFSFTKLPSENHVQPITSNGVGSTSFGVDRPNLFPPPAKPSVSESPKRLPIFGFGSSAASSASSFGSMSTPTPTISTPFALPSTQNGSAKTPTSPAVIRREPPPVSFSSPSFGSSTSPAKPNPFTSSPSGFSSGQPSESTSKALQTPSVPPAFAFGVPSTPKNDSPQKPVTFSTFSFGTPPSSTKDTPVASKLSFGSPSGPSTSFGSFGQTSSFSEQSSKPASGFGAAFGSSFNSQQEPRPGFGAPAVSTSAFSQQPAKPMFNFGVPTGTSPTFGTGNDQTSPSFGQWSKPPTSANPFATVTSATSASTPESQDDNSHDDDKENERPKVIELSDDEDDEKDAEDDGPYEREDDGYVYGDQDEEVAYTYDEEDEDEDEDEERDDEYYEEEGFGGEGGSGADDNEEEQGRASPDSQKQSNGMFKPSSGFSFTQPFANHGNQSSSFASSTFGSSTKPASWGSAGLIESPEFSFEFGQGLLPVAQPGSPTPKLVIYEREEGPLLRGEALSDYEVAPITCDEEGFYTEDGTISPMESPVLSPRTIS